VLAIKSELTQYLKIEENLKMQEEKPTLNNHLCVVKCDSYYADYIVYTTRHLFQSIEEHITSVIGNNMKEVHGVKFTDPAEMFSVLKKCRGKLDCLTQEKPFIR